MIKRIFPIMILSAILLAACQGSSPTTTEDPLSLTEVAATATKPEPTIEPTPVGKEASAQPTAVQADASTDSPPPGCTVVSPITGPEPTAESPFPTVSDEEWVLGPESAAVTLIEYGDFQ